MLNYLLIYIGQVFVGKLLVGFGFKGFLFSFKLLFFSLSTYQRKCKLNFEVIFLYILGKTKLSLKHGGEEFSNFLLGVPKQLRKGKMILLYRFRLRKYYLIETR